MAMRSSKNIWDFFGRLNKVNTIILDAYQGYTLAPQDPVPDQTGNITMTQVEHQAYKKALVDNVVEFYLLNQFRAALPLDLRRVINLQPMHSLDLDTAVRLATIELRSKDEARGTSRIQAVQKEKDKDNVEAVTQNRQKKFNPKINKIGVNRAVKISDHRTMAFPRSDRQYALITDAATGTADFSGGLGAILTQIDKDGFQTTQRS